jgi:hypothetical protein
VLGIMHSKELWLFGTKRQIVLEPPASHTDIGFTPKPLMQRVNETSFAVAYSEHAIHYTVNMLRISAPSQPKMASMIIIDYHRSGGTWSKSLVQRGFHSVHVLDHRQGTAKVHA